jgi:transposase
MIVGLGVDQQIRASSWANGGVDGQISGNAVRHAVIWRRISGGTDSQAGSRFVERMLTVVATCRRQGRNVLDDLSSCFQAARNGQAIPALLSVAQAEIKAA